MDFKTGSPTRLFQCEFFRLASFHGLETSTEPSHAYNGAIHFHYCVSMLKLLSRLPLSVLYLLSGLAYLLLFYVAKYRRKEVVEHLQQAFPEKTERERLQIAKAFYRNLADVLMESIHSANMNEEEFAQRVEHVNLEVLEPLVKQGSSFILLAGHCNNWEWLLLSTCIKLPIPMDVVYKPLHNKASDKFMYDTRSRFGVEPIDLKEFATEVIKRKGVQRAYSILADQRPGSKGRAHVTEFLNRETRFFIGPEKIAQFVKMPVVFVKMTRVARGHYQVAFEILAEPPYEKKRDHYPVTEQYVRALEQQIKASPEGWLWSNRRWKQT